MSADDPVVYDRAGWHSEGDWPNGLPRSQACVHAGLFLGWVIDRGLVSAAFAGDFPQLLEAFRSRRKTGPQVYALAGGILASDMLSDVGNAFARAYYDLESGHFLAEYEALLASSLPSAYHVADTWPNYEKLRAHLDARFDAWVAAWG